MLTLGLNSVKWQISSISGILVIILYCAFTFSSRALYPTAYSPVTNWLSDLGNSTYNPHGAILYNLGCILTGIALFPFFIGLYKWYSEEKRFRKRLLVVQTIGCLAAFSLIVIGVFSENAGWIHNMWSEVFFVLNWIVLVLIGASLFNHPRYIKATSYYAFVVAAFNLMFAVLPSTPLT